MTDTGRPTAEDTRALLTGYPRIGPNRELKWLLERAWRGEIDADALQRGLDQRKADHLAEQHDLVGSAVDDFWIYDQVLETALMFGLVPEEHRSRLTHDPFGVLTDLARGTPDEPAWEMTKWFDTNYHFVVPDGDGREPRLDAPAWRRPQGDAWNVLGPYSFARLSRLRELDVAGLIEQYQALAADAGVTLVIDEPCIGLELGPADRELLERAYAPLRPGAGVIVTSALATPEEATLSLLAARGVAVQVHAADLPRMARLAAWGDMPEQVVGAVDGRTPWPDSWEPIAAAAESFDGRPVVLVPTISLSFLPYTVEGELEAAAAGLQFAREKARTLAGWAAALRGEAPVPDLGEEGGQRTADWPAPTDIPARPPRAERRQAQVGHRELPTTTIGSFPQTAAVRQLRRRLAARELSDAEYLAAIDEAIVAAIRWQEQAGLDVLVHGEFERTDMVEYFAERLDGFLTTNHGWVVSYGTRCTRPPILVAPPSSDRALTVREWIVAQAATDRPVKGMLTGPVTIVNWSYRPPDVPDELLFWAVARAVEAEVRRLIDAGARVIQVDEPAVRERWPLRTPGWQERQSRYRDGARRALQLVFHQPGHVQMHTHMCYSDFGEIVDVWRGVDVDVASIEFTRSGDPTYIEAFAELGWEIGPGLFDVHSPHRPGAGGVAERLQQALALIPRERLWVNPDCGLKTRSWAEVEAQVADMLAGADEVRSHEPVPA